MAQIDVTVSGRVSSSARARQLEAMFDVPRAETQTLHWGFTADYDNGEPWNVGLLVGPSGCGKSTLLREQFGQPHIFAWDAPSVIDAFDPELSIKDVASACQAVGFNTIPAWLRPHHVLSNGEQFRADLARQLIEGERAKRTVVIDEFTSVVDRQVAKIGAHAVAKYARRHDMRVVLASCHYDIVDWLSPDWVIEPAERRFSWRSVQPRPPVDVTISPVPYAAWSLFAPFHYLTAELNRAARCYVLFVGDEPAAFAGVLYRPHSKVADIFGISRLVTLPDWQGLGLAFVLADALGAAFTAAGQRLHTYPAHPALIHSFDRSPLWSMKQRPGMSGRGSVNRGPRAKISAEWRAGSRPCAMFEYAGPRGDVDDAKRLLSNQRSLTFRAPMKTSTR